MIPCPSCKLDMKEYRDGAALLSRCNNCELLWLEPPTLQQVVRSLDRAFQPSELKALRSRCLRRKEEAVSGTKEIDTPIEYLNCPICSAMMQRKSFARVSFVLTHFCQGHGYLISVTDYSRLKDFIACGGEILMLDKLRQDQAMRISELEHELSKKKGKIGMTLGTADNDVAMLMEVLGCHAKKGKKL
jgi:Zn-finger nucleic acid-binding protein